METSILGEECNPFCELNGLNESVKKERRKEIKMFILFLQLQISDVRSNSILWIKDEDWNWVEDWCFSMELSLERNWLDYAASDTSSSSKIEIRFPKDFKWKKITRPNILNWNVPTPLCLYKLGPFKQYVTLFWHFLA